MYGLLFVLMLIGGFVLFFAGLMEVFVVERTGSWRVGGLCILASAMLVAGAVLIERFILRALVS